MTSIEKYHAVLKEHAAKQGLIMNPDWDTVKPLLEGLLRRGELDVVRTCPCRISSGDVQKDRDIVCPCVYAKPDIEEYGTCYCNLFASQDWIDGKVPHVPVPERRPPEKTLAL
jgi:ferredoxin-thioredoxin reductase catalytic subunit